LAGGFWPHGIELMLIKIGYDIALRLFTATSIIFVLRVHPSRKTDLIEGEDFRVEPSLPVEDYFDIFQNHCGRVNAPSGVVRFRNNGIIRDSGESDIFEPDVGQSEISDLPISTLTFVLPSRYCEVDSELLDFAWNTFQKTPPGWARVQAICDFVHSHLRFDYLQARSNRTALEAFREKVGVCRDFTHLAITLCRCLNIPARYVTGYLGDIGVPPDPNPMDFSAWFEVFLGQQWFTFDARHNRRRIGRIVIGRGRDAGDVPIAMVFGRHILEHFEVITHEVKG
jgi:transglutaminase-like putative cysteine protease